MLASRVQTGLYVETSCIGENSCGFFLLSDHAWLPAIPEGHRFSWPELTQFCIQMSHQTDLTFLSPRSPRSPSVTQVYPGTKLENTLAEGRGAARAGRRVWYSFFVQGHRTKVPSFAAALQARSRSFVSGTVMPYRAQKNALISHVRLERLSIKITFCHAMLFFFFDTGTFSFLLNA